jgi:hypothetical protein
MNLPQELFDIIIDGLNGSLWALRNCSLVCRSWVHSSRRHLFRRIALVPPHSRHISHRGVCESHCQRLHRILLGSPHIATYIRELKVFEGQEWMNRAWIGLDQTLPLVLGLLGDLTKIELYRLDWEILPQELRQSICQVLGLPSMTSVEIERSDFGSMDDICSFLSHAEGLTSLSLSDINIKHRSLAHGDTKHGVVGKGQGDRSNHQRWHLLDLRLNLAGCLRSDGCSKFVNWLLGSQSPSDVLHIRTLHVSHYRQSHVHAVNKLLYAIGSSLRHFQLNQPILRSE